MTQPSRMRQILDWRAATIAGLVAGTLFLLVMMITTAVQGDSVWLVFRFFSALILGSEVLLGLTTFSFATFIVGLLVHYVLAMSFTYLLTFVLHKWGLWVGILGGALFGLGLYVINFYLLTLVFDWFFALRSTTFLIIHVLFGAVAGGVYEALEVEIFVPIEEE